MKGVDFNTVRELLGHADIKMTLRYAHLAPEHKASAVAKLVEYELNGSDRAVYGQNVIEHLAKELTKQKIPHCSASRLWDYRNFYKTYPEILQSLPGEFKYYINHIYLGMMKFSSQ